MCEYCEPQEEYQNVAFYHDLPNPDEWSVWKGISIQAFDSAWIHLDHGVYTLDIDVGYNQGYDSDGTHSIGGIPLNKCPVCGRNLNSPISDCR